MTKLSRRRDVSIKLGTVQGAKHAAVEFGEKEFATHMAVYGGTGKGKTKFLELIIRQLIDQGRGACIIDPHGDLVEDLLSYVMHRKDALDPKLIERIHYFEPGLKDCGFSFDPFHYEKSVDGDYDYADWLKAKVESVARVIIRKQGESDFQGKPRLERFLTNVLYGVGTVINEKGDHLALADAEILLNTGEEYQGVFDAVFKHLPTEVASDFKKVRGSKSAKDQEAWVESTIGRLRSFLSPIVKSLFTNEAEKPVRFREIVEQQGIMLVNLRRTRSFTLDQSNALGGLFINEVLEAVETADRTNRKPFFLFVDEASRFVGQDLMDALGQFRKWKLSLCLAVQDLSSLRGKEIDMTPKVMSQCGIQVTFQQKYPDDVDVLASLMGQPALDFTRKVEEVDRPDGYDGIDTESNTVGSSTSHSRGSTNSSSSTRSKGSSHELNSARERSYRESETTGQGEGDSNSESTGSTESSSKTYGKQFLSRTRVERRDTGRFETSVSDQFEMVKTSIRKLKMGTAMMLVDEVPPFILNVHNVETAYSSIPEAKRAETLEKYKRRICRSHEYCVKTKRLTQEERLDKFTEEKLLGKNKEDNIPFSD